MNGKISQEKYETFQRKSNEGVERYFPNYKVRSSKHTWYNARCAEARRAKDRAWRELRKQLKTIEK